MPNLSLLDLSENPFQIASTRGKFFTFNNNLYIVYVEEDKKIKIKKDTEINDIYDRSQSVEKFVIYDIYLDSNILYICGSYGNNGFYLTYNLNSSSYISFTQISSVDLISHIFILNNKIHLIHRTRTSIGMSISYPGTFSTVTILNNLTPQKNAYVRDYLLNANNLFIFVEQEDDTSSYKNLKFYYHKN
jgi:hypothetical protein